MTPLEMYERIRHGVDQGTLVPPQENAVTVTVQMGVCSQAAGALRVVLALEETIFRYGLSQVRIQQTGCRGACAYEPIVTVSRIGSAPITYVRVTPEKARILLTEYAFKSRVIPSWTVGGKEVTL